MAALLEAERREKRALAAGRRETAATVVQRLVRARQAAQAAAARRATMLPCDDADDDGGAGGDQFLSLFGGGGGDGTGGRGAGGAECSSNGDGNGENAPARPSLAVLALFGCVSFVNTVVPPLVARFSRLTRLSLRGCCLGLRGHTVTSSTSSGHTLEPLFQPNQRGS